MSKPYIRDNNCRKFDVINFRIVRLPNKTYTIQAQRQFFFKKIKIWTGISEFKGYREYSSLVLEDVMYNVEKWRTFYEDLAEEKASSRTIVDTIEVRKRETHPELFI